MSSYARNYHPRGGTYRNDYWSLNNRNSFNNNTYRNRHVNYAKNYNNHYQGSGQVGEFIGYSNFEDVQPDGPPSMKRRRYTSSTWGDCRRSYVPPTTCDNASFACNNVVPLPSRSNADASTSNSNKRDRSHLDDDEMVFMSRDEIERLSPSRKDGIDLIRENHLRYTYCNFLQNLGLRLDLPQPTIGTAMVLCHRFFVRRSHACHDRFLIATAALFLAAKSEETARPLNNVLRASCYFFHKQDISYLSYLLPVDWFEQYRERVIEAEQLILTTLNFELNVQHPYGPLTAVLSKLGLSHTDLLSLALNLISQGDCKWLYSYNDVMGVRTSIHCGLVEV
ncbi:cyclin-T1-3-like isoform X2 [Punica granatum]|uniref:Cyclin-T1-3-like isoform X2 n=1 Tax=Punica granatum TaxID=22663 RepID=A0A6P8DVX0_PUNGR|nr:cyclin-T1-3-like isoform X2 [Punica granatum]